MKNATTPPPTSRILRPRDAAKKLGIARPTLYRWSKVGILPRRRVIGPGVVGWLEVELDEFLATRPTEGEARPVPRRGAA
jgi:predicted DNA-binding transcriptional regulator AlpA